MLDLISKVLVIMLRFITLLFKEKYVDQYLVFALSFRAGLIFLTVSGVGAIFLMASGGGSTFLLQNFFVKKIGILYAYDL